MMSICSILHDVFHMLQVGVYILNHLNGGLSGIYSNYVLPVCMSHIEEHSHFVENRCDLHLVPDVLSLPHSCLLAHQDQHFKLWILINSTTDYR